MGISDAHTCGQAQRHAEDLQQSGAAGSQGSGAAAGASAWSASCGLAVIAKAWPTQCDPAALSAAPIARSLHGIAMFMDICTDACADPIPFKTRIRLSNTRSSTVDTDITAR